MSIKEDAMWTLAKKMGMPESAIEAVKAKREQAAKDGKKVGMPDIGKIMEMMKSMGGKDDMLKMARKMGMPMLPQGMDGQEVLSRLKNLSAVSTVKDLPVLSHALFPGTHCPLMGAEMALAGIKDCLMVIVGTDECSYYTKGMTINERFGGLNGRCVSVVLDSHAVTFGSSQLMLETFKEIMEEYKPSCVALVTTCVIEVIGDDYDAIAVELEKKYGIPVMAIHTEHFKCQDHFPGLERTISACYHLMEPQEKIDSVNVLGQRMGSFAGTELHEQLVRAGVKVGMQLPSGTTCEEIRRAPAAKVNIVVHDIALPLAKRMEEEMGVPYVYFNKYADPEKIWESYQRLYSYLQLELPKDLEEKYQQCKAAEENAKAELEGMTFIYGNTPFDGFELCSYLCKLGMRPQLIQSNRFSEVNYQDVKDILAYTDPLICRAANIAPLRPVYDELHPYMYIGHEFGDVLRKKGIAILHTDRAGAMQGFEVHAFLLQQLLATAKEALEYRKEVGL